MMLIFSVKLQCVRIHLLNFNIFFCLVIGDLAQVGGTLMGKYVNDLLPILLDILNDASSSQKREVSLWTLAQLVESTGAVVTPYSRYILTQIFC